MLKVFRLITESICKFFSFCAHDRQHTYNYKKRLSIAWRRLCNPHSLCRFLSSEFRNSLLTPRFSLDARSTYNIYR
jgi:hypothetical protein